MTHSVPEPTDPIAEGRKIWTEAAKEGDAAKIATVYSNDIVLMPPNETSLYGKDEAMEWWAEYFQFFKIAVLSGTERDVRMVGDLAIEQYTYMIAIDPVGGGERIRDDGRQLSVWKREADGLWRVSETIWNSIRPIGSGTSRFLARLKKH